MMRVNGVEVAASGTLLEACRRAGADVPAFCHDERTGAGGHCRACLVEAGGRTVAACRTPARDGLEVRTDTPRLEAYRQDLGELMVSESAPGGEVATRLRAWDVTGFRYEPARAHHEPDTSHPYLRVDLARCILCRKCLHACEDVQGRFVYAIEGRGSRARLAWGGGSFAESACVSCGACVAACPTEALTDVDRLGAPSGTAPVRTTCGYCGVGCQLEVHAADDRVARIDGADAAVNRGHLCVKGRYAHAFSRHPERLSTPLVRRNGVLEPASWEEAISLVADGMRRANGAVAGLSSSRCTNEENYLFQKWIRLAFGTNDVDCCARVCHAPSATGMRAAFGTGAATNSLDDIERADVLLLTGANATEAHPVTGARIRQAALRGATLVVIDPRRTELAEIADLHLQLRPGTNVPLLNAIACAMVEEGLVDRAFVEARAEGWTEYEAFIRAQTPERAELVTGVPAATIREAARAYGRARRPMSLHGLGVTEHLQGSEAVMLICNLALLAGAIGREGVGVNPLRGQNNVQGAADMGCQPDTYPGYQPVADAAVRARFEAAWGRALPAAPGRTLPRVYDAIERREVRALYLFGEDVMQTEPDTRRIRRLLESLEFLVVQELFLSETAKLAHVVLSWASFLEKDGTFTNGERRIQRVRRALDPVPGSRPDWEILLALMEATGVRQDLRSPSEIWDEIARLTPMVAGVSYARLEGDGLQWPVPAAGHPGTPILHIEAFPRGRGRLSCVEFVPSPSLGGPLTLVTGRSLEHYNAGTMTRRTDNLRLAPEERIELHPEDARARGVADGDLVSVRSDRGEVRVRARVTDRVRRGAAFMTFHFPETPTNVLTGDVRDRMCDCPEYKVTAVEVRRPG